MYKNLNAASVGLGGRSNELIEAALTHKFRSFDIDIDGLVKQAESRGLESATRLIKSANIQVNSFELTSAWYGSDDEFQTELKRLEQLIPLALSVGATRCIAHVCPFNDYQPYHETFELHRKRIGQVAQLLRPHAMQLGLGFLAPAHHREGHGSQFIATVDALLALFKLGVDANVGLCVDVWHWFLGGGSLESLLSFDPAKVVELRLADLPEGATASSITEEQRLLPGSTGVVPVVPILRWLQQHAYAGPVTIYCHPSQFTSPKRMQAVAQISELHEQLVRQVAESADAEPVGAGR